MKTAKLNRMIELDTAIKAWEIELKSLKVDFIESEMTIFEAEDGTKIKLSSQEKLDWDQSQITDLRKALNGTFDDHFKIKFSHESKPSILKLSQKDTKIGKAVKAALTLTESPRILFQYPKAK